MEAWGSFRLQPANELLECLLLLRWTLQLEQDVIHLQIMRDCATVVGGACCGMGVALERDPICFIDALRDSRTSLRARVDLCVDARDRNKNSENDDEEENQLTKHAPPFVLGHAGTCSGNGSEG